MSRDAKDLLKAASTLQRHFKSVEKRLSDDQDPINMVLGVTANFSHEIMEVCVATLENQVKLEKEIADLKKQMAELVKPNHITKPKLSR